MTRESAELSSDDRSWAAAKVESVKDEMEECSVDKVLVSVGCMEPCFKV